MRKKRLLLNTCCSLLLRIITIICGFVTPRLILEAFGSDTNGLVTSISHFLSIISFLDLGVGSVVKSTLYKPLAYQDDDQLSRIMVSAHRFFDKLALAFLVYVCILFFAYPLFVDQSLGRLFTATLILAVAAKAFAENYLGIVESLLLNADQRGFITDILRTLCVLISTLVSIILIKSGSSIHTVKFAVAGTYLLTPIFQRIYIRRSYKINSKIKLTDEPITQKTNCIIQHVATVIMDSADNIILTLFSTLQNISVYSVYHLVVFGIKQLVGSLTSGIQSLFGELWAKQEIEKLADVFAWTEWVFHTTTVFVFGCTAMLVSPFVQVYTKGISDANYVQPVFGCILALAHAAHCLRYPYNKIILAVGHYKQTQNSYIVATGINLIISIAVVKSHGLIGVAAGTLVGMLYHTIWMARYSSKHILNQKINPFIKQLFVDGITFILAATLSKSFTLQSANYVSWIMLAVKVTSVWLFVTLSMNFIFYKDRMSSILRRLRV